MTTHAFRVYFAQGGTVYALNDLCPAALNIDKTDYSSSIAPAATAASIRAIGPSNSESLTATAAFCSEGALLEAAAAAEPVAAALVGAFTTTTAVLVDCCPLPSVKTTTCVDVEGPTTVSLDAEPVTVTNPPPLVE